jgi:hypothetical protein
MKLRKVTTLQGLRDASKRRPLAVECPEIEAVLWVNAPTAGLYAQLADLAAAGKEGGASSAHEGNRLLLAKCLCDEAGEPLEGDVCSALADLPLQTFLKLVSACMSLVDPAKKSAPSGAEVAVQAGEGTGNDGGAA